MLTIQERWPPNCSDSARAPYRPRPVCGSEAGEAFDAALDRAGIDSGDEIGDVELKDERVGNGRTVWAKVRAKTHARR